MDIKYFDPVKLLQLTAKSMDCIPQIELFNKPQHQKLTESWCAAMFAIGYSRHVAECQVGVNETKDRVDADFFLKTKEQIWPFQLAEVQEENRQRGLEYKNFADGTIKTVPYSPAKGHERGPDWIRNGITKKKQKNYAGSNELNLLIYANFSTSDLQYETIVEKTKEFEGIFLSIWIITSLYMCSIFSAKKLGNVSGWRAVRSIENYYL